MKNPVVAWFTFTELFNLAAGFLLTRKGHVDTPPRPPCMGLSLPKPEEDAPGRLAFFFYFLPCGAFTGNQGNAPRVT